MATISMLSRLFKRQYQPIAYMKRKHPKAARKRRVIKKWVSRFGAEIDFGKMATTENALMLKIPKDTWTGSSYHIPESLTNKMLTEAFGLDAKPD